MLCATHHQNVTLALAPETAAPERRRGRWAVPLRPQRLCKRLPVKTLSFVSILMQMPREALQDDARHGLGRSLKHVPESIRQTARAQDFVLVSGKCVVAIMFALHSAVGEKKAMENEAPVSENYAISFRSAHASIASTRLRSAESYSCGCWEIGCLHHLRGRDRACDDRPNSRPRQDGERQLRLAASVGFSPEARLHFHTPAGSVQAKSSQTRCSPSCAQRRSYRLPSLLGRWRK